MLLLLSIACLNHQPRPTDALDWDLYPELVSGLIHVAPVIVLSELPQAELNDSVGQRLDPWLAQGRIERTQELAALPDAFRTAVPGALHRTLPSDWEAHFMDGKLPKTQQAHLSNALTDPETSLGRAFSQAAQTMGGDATLFTWVIHSEGSPLTNTYMVGELVWAAGQPVMVDHISEPYTVRAELGLALVNAHGQVLFRHQADYAGVLSKEHGLSLLSREFANAAVADIAPHWLGEPVVGPPEILFVQTH